jgi:hypothetical protein
VTFALGVMLSRLATMVQMSKMLDVLESFINLHGYT